jgi:hypothetical protein
MISKGQAAGEKLAEDSSLKGRTTRGHAGDGDRQQDDHAERIDFERAAAKAGLTLDPGFTIRRDRANALSDNPKHLAGRESP